jgi:hypothetical protein
VTGAAGVDELLARLVAQFASPYDFLRELVQNSMDAGSDRVDVVLHTHEAGDAVVYEIEAIDAGHGMDEPIIDGELTRLFSSGKSGDRRMAGGFGIGFVSVFAWQPQVVLLHTGRNTESWEVQFFEDRRFEKRRLDEPVEGTTIRLFRRGQASERGAIAHAIRDSLWRWCRYVPIDITFEDRAAGSGVETIHEDPLPEDELLFTVHEAGDTRVRVAFAAPGHAVLLRRGLVLAEGAPADVLPHAAAQIAGSFDHLRVWADSSSLRTDIGRDHVLDDAGRAAVEKVVVAKVLELRGALAVRLATLAATPTAWTAQLHREYAYLHAHLRCEDDVSGDGIVKLPVLRRPVGEPTSVAALASLAIHGVVARCEPADAAALTTIALAARAGVPTLVATDDDATAWLDPWLAVSGMISLPLGDVVREVTEATSGAGLAALVGRMLAGPKIAASVAIGQLGATPDVLWALAPSATPGIAITRARRLRGGPHAVWIDERHVLVKAAMIHFPAQPVVAAASVALAIAASWPEPKPDIDDLLESIDAARQEAGA